MGLGDVLLIVSISAFCFAVTYIFCSASLCCFCVCGEALLSSGLSVCLSVHTATCEHGSSSTSGGKLTLLGSRDGLIRLWSNSLRS